MAVNVFPGGQGPGLRIGIVIKRDDDPDMAGRVKVWLPGRYGLNVEPEHLAYCNIMTSPNAQNQNFSGMTLQNGTMVYVQGDTGSPNMMIVGIAGSEVPQFNGNPGNTDLLGIIQHIQYAFNNDSSNGDNRNRKPKWKDENVRGALRRTVQEIGPFFHRLKNGIPSTGMLPILAGLITPTKPQIHTAKQQYNSIPTASMLSNLPGTVLTIGNILQTILQNRKLRNRATSNMDTQTIAAFENIAENMSYGENNDGLRVDQNIFSNNAANLISTCTTTADIVNCIQELQSNTAYHGTNTFANTTYEVTGPFGNTVLSIDHTGNVSENNNNNTQQALNTFMNLLRTFSGFPSSKNGQNLFGNSAPTMMNMIGRVPNSMQSQIISMLNATNTESNPKRGDAFTVLKAIQGGLSLLRR